MKKLFKMFKDDEPEILNAHDLNVYSPYRWFRLPGQTLDIKPQGEMKDFILPFIHPDSNPLSFDNTTTTNNKIDDQIFKSIDKPIKKLFHYDSSIKFKITDEQIADLLSELPFEYIEDYDKWSIITNVFKGLDKKIYGINGHINQIDTTKLKIIRYGEILKKLNLILIILSMS